LLFRNELVGTSDPGSELPTLFFWIDREPLVGSSKELPAIVGTSDQAVSG